MLNLINLTASCLLLELFVVMRISRKDDSEDKGMMREGTRGRGGGGGGEGRDDRTK